MTSTKKLDQLQENYTEQLVEERIRDQDPDKDPTVTSLSYEELVQLSCVIDFNHMLKISNFITSEILLRAISNQAAADRTLLLLKLLKSKILLCEIFPYSDNHLI